jgi:hypothetical protein
MRQKASKLALALSGVLLFASGAAADTVLDFTDVLPDSGSINGALFSTNAQQPTGSGVIHSFVRISKANSEAVQGYNTDARPLQFDENSSPTFTRSLNKSALQSVTIGSDSYYQFLLDINQEGSDPLLSLNELQIFVGNTGSPTGATVNATTGTLSFGSQATLVYDMDGLDDANPNTSSRIDLDYNFNSGSGSGDMYAYIPTALFSGGDFITLYSKFGDLPFGNNDGYEEWAAIVGADTVIPLPAAAWAGMALFGALGASKLRRRAQQEE